MTAIKGLLKSKELENTLRSEITKHLKPGDLLLPEMQLAEKYSVGRITVRKAVESLVIEGILQRIQGKGTFVVEKDKKLKKQIAVIVFHSDNPYYSKIIRGVEQVMAEASFNTILCNSKGSPEKETEHIMRLISSVDGFIVAPTHELNAYSKGVNMISRSKIPLVFICHIINGQEINASADYAIPDNYGGGFMAGQHFFERGYRNFRCLMPEKGIQSDDVRERLYGFKSALEQNGMKFDDTMIVEISGNDTRNAYELDAYMATGKILAGYAPPMGIFAGGDPMAIGLMRGLRERKIRIPEDVGICGFDDIELARQWGISLTTIAQKKIETGIKAAEILLKRIKNIKNDVEHITMPVNLIERNTTLTAFENPVAEGNELSHV